MLTSNRVLDPMLDPKQSIFTNFYIQLVFSKLRSARNRKHSDQNISPRLSPNSKMAGGAERQNSSLARTSQFRAHLELACLVFPFSYPLSLFFYQGLQHIHFPLSWQLDSLWKSLFPVATVFYRFNTTWFPLIFPRDRFRKELKYLRHLISSPKIIWRILANYQLDFSLFFFFFSLLFSFLFLYPLNPSNATHLSTNSLLVVVPEKTKPNHHKSSVRPIILLILQCLSFIFLSS